MKIVWTLGAICCTSCFVVIVVIAVILIIVTHMVYIEPFGPMTDTTPIEFNTSSFLKYLTIQTSSASLSL